MKNTTHLVGASFEMFYNQIFRTVLIILLVVPILGNANTIELVDPNTILNESLQSTVSEQSKIIMEFHLLVQVS